MEKTIIARLDLTEIDLEEICAEQRVDEAGDLRLPIVVIDDDPVEGGKKG